MWEKLKREWKTFSLAVVTILIGTWEAASTAGYDISPLIPEKYRAYAIPVIGILFLALRQWRDYKAKDVADK